jgi:hypothetical protein
VNLELIVKSLRKAERAAHHRDSQSEHEKSTETVSNAHFFFFSPNS